MKFESAAKRQPRYRSSRHWSNCQTGSDPQNKKQMRRQHMISKLERVMRLDSLPIVKASFTDEGYLEDKPILTSTGIFEYTNSDGTIRRELRLPEEVFSEESLASYKGKPIIITHDAGLVTNENVHENQIGTILSEGIQDGNDVRAEIIIHDTDEMKRAGLKELSLGYNLELDETPGTWHGEPYDAIQRDIRINHLALVREARAGEQARLNIDSRCGKTILEGGTVAMKTNGEATGKATKRADGVLSEEELEKAVKEYLARRSKQNKQDGDPEDQKPAPAATEDADDTGVAESETQNLEQQAQEIKDNRNRRNTEGDPKNVDEAMDVISNQNEDINTLFDIIDSLLAKLDFQNIDGADTSIPDTAEPAPIPPKAKEYGEKGTQEDCGGNGHQDDEGIPNSESPDSDTPDSEIPDKEDEEEQPTGGQEKKTMNSDSIDRIVRERIELGSIGRMLNMDGLENVGILKAKKAIINAVHPGMRLDGKSDAYINGAYSSAVKVVKARARKDADYQRRQMFNRDSRVERQDSSSATAARERMIERMQKKGDQ